MDTCLHSETKNLRNIISLFISYVVHHVLLFIYCISAFKNLDNTIKRLPKNIKNLIPQVKLLYIKNQNFLLQQATGENVKCKEACSRQYLDIALVALGTE